MARMKAMTLARKEKETEAGDGVNPAKEGPPHLMGQSWYLLNRAAQQARELVEDSLEPLGMRRRHYATLGVIFEQGMVSQQDLSKKIPIDQPSLVTVVDDLEKLGLAKRKPNPDDRRARFVVLTEKGIRTLKLASKNIAEAEQLALAPLSIAERKQIDILARRICRWD